MESSRIEMLRTMVDQNPGEPFARYGLAMEYSKSGNLEEAVREYRALLEQNESYAAAYYHGGQALEKMGRVEEAREMYEKGIEVTTRSGDMKTRNELQAAADILPL
jgi:tetratricopeptide (TPR) repeat protein